MEVTKLYPGGKRKAATFSYDDGHLHDIRLLDLFQQYGVKGTFNLNSGWIMKPTDGLVTADQVKELYAGQEVAVHCVTHPQLPELSRDEIRREIGDDMHNLSELVGYPVRGMAYPYGNYNETTIEVMRELGIRYSRTCKDHGTFALPDKPLEWGATCHHNAPNLFALITDFAQTRQELALLYIWGHSFEFDREQKWDLAEEMCAAVGKLEDTYFATNMEILDYLDAAAQLKTDGGSVVNQADVPVWISVDGTVHELAPGAAL